MSPIPKFLQSAWSKAQENPGEVNANLAFYRFFELRDKEPKTDPGFRFMMNVALEGQCAHLLSRQVQQIDGLKKQGWVAGRWVQVTQSRLACGLGIPHPSNNGLLLDRVSGAPYLPGSYLKGLALDMALEERNELDGQKRLETEALIQAVFGAVPSDSQDTSKIKGCLHFFDAFPDVTSGEGKKPFQKDIVNPHYGDYYGSSGKTPPADYLAPNPSYFLTVRQGVRFGFALAARVPKTAMQFTAQDLLEKARAWLQTALQELGAGGKTRVGYGIFGPVTEESCSIP